MTQQKTCVCGTTGQELRYFAAGSDFCPNAPNPFTDDSAYGPAWTALIVSDADPVGDFMGCNEARDLFFYRLGRSLPALERRAADFVRHENGQGRNVIVALPEDPELGAFLERVLSETPGPHVVRATDPKCVVHSTSWECGKRILADGELKALSLLMAEGAIKEPRLGHHGLCEPAEYADHINFAAHTSPWPEAVVSSNQKGRFVELDEPYRPGYRFYFDAHKIIRQGLDVRTGCHYFCVRHRLPLDGLLLEAIGLEDVDPEEKATWTPRSYAVEANRAFEARRRLKEGIC